MDSYNRDPDRDQPFNHPTHYYGDIVRRQLIAAGIAILCATLIDTELRSFYFFIGAFGVLTFIVLAALASPISRRSILAITCVAGVMFLIFEYFAIDAYSRHNTVFDVVFFFRQLIAVIFLFSVYFGTKTLRGMSLWR